jgi:hemerythrin superfamily protein
MKKLGKLLTGHSIAEEVAIYPVVEKLASLVENLVGVQ